MVRKTMVLLCVACLFSGATNNGSAQSDEMDVLDMYAERALVIVASVADYEAAHGIALEAAETPGFELDLRGLVPHPESGLTFSREECEEEWLYPCFIPRERFADLVSVSVEYTGYYGDDLEEGYYIVVVASGDPDSPLLSGVLEKARGYWPDAYLARTSVYMGCMH